MKRSPLVKILFVYFLFSMLTLLSWQIRDWNSVTGDEPNYLIMANGIAKYATLEQSEPFKEEFRTKEIFKHGLAPADSELTPDNSHTVSGPNGKFSVHNIGLPFLLTIPFFLGGTFGAKLFMVFCCSLIIVLAWKFSGVFSTNEKHRYWVVITVGIAMPFVSASNQIYPDILAGLISLTGLYWFITSQRKRSTLHELLLASAIVFLPWLQIKFAASCVLIVLAVAVKIYLESKDIQRVQRLLLLAVASCILLALYNNYAFGKISGPYHSDALEISKTSLMVLFGLHFDQNQGFLLQNPVNLIGVLAIAWLYRFNRPFTIIWGLVFLSLIVPNSLHPNWFGGWSFSGRFALSAATVFTDPTIYGLIRLAEIKEKLFQQIVKLSLLLQFYFFYFYAVRLVNAYNKPTETWFDGYPIFYIPVKSWLPMLYNSQWAFSYTPNYAWMGVIVSLFIMGFLSKKRLLCIATSATMIFGGSLAFAGLYNNHPDINVTFKVTDLPSKSGRLAGSLRLAEQGIDQPGYLTYGPYLSLGKGNYEVTVKYSSSAPGTQLVGSFDVFDSTSGKQESLIPLNGTDGSIKELKIAFSVNAFSPHVFEFRNKWDGTLNLKIYDIHLQKA